MLGTFSAGIDHVEVNLPSLFPEPIRHQTSETTKLYWVTMLQIRLSRGTSAESGGGTRSLPVETVTVTCPDHLVLADLPVAKSLGSVTAANLVKSIGRRSRRHLGERVHFCVRCDFPIAIYGRLSPCEHVFCLDCARSDSICYLCDERIQKIQTIKMMEGIFICAAPHCLKSFLKRTQFESHIHDHHSNLFHADSEKEDGNESEAQSFRHPAASESSAKAQQRQAQAHSPSAQSLPQDRDDKACRQPHWEPSLPRPAIQSRPSPLFGPGKNIPPDQQVDSCPPGFEGTMPSDAQFVDLSPRPFVMPGHSLNPPFGYAHFPDGIQSFYGAPNEMTMGRPDAGPDQGSLLGFPPGLDLLGGPVGGDYGRDMAMERQSSSLLPLPLSVKRGQSYGGKMDDDGQGFGWEGHRYC